MSDDNSWCNDTCCVFNEDEIICFNDYNFTDKYNLTHPTAWELAVRWSVVVPMVIVGVLGNLTIIIILLKNRLLMRTSVNIFILNMAVSDMILSIAGPIPFTIRCTHQFWVLGELWCHLDGLIEVTLMEVSVNSLAIISVDRLLGIYNKSYKHLKKWKALLIIACIWFVSGLLGTPFYIFRNYGVHIWADLTEVYCEEVITKTKYYWIPIIIFLNWIPLIVMTTSYILLFSGYKKHSLKAEGKERSGVLKTKKRFINMLFANVIAFAICWLPFQAFIMYREKIIISDGGRVTNTKAYNITFNVAQYIVYLYPVVNPFIYGFMHQNFKNGFRVTFPCFFKEEADFMLMRSHGRQAYVWSRASSRKVSLETRRCERIKRMETQRRAFSVNDLVLQPETKESPNRNARKRTIVKFQRSSSDTSDYTTDITRPSRSSDTSDYTTDTIRPIRSPSSLDLDGTTNLSPFTVCLKVPTSQKEGSEEICTDKTETVVQEKSS